MDTNRNTALQIAVIFLAAFLMIAPLALSAFAQNAPVGPADETATQSVIRDQIGAFQTGEHDRAYSHAAPNIQRIFPSVDRFIGMVQSGYPMVYDPAQWNFGRNMFAYGEVYQEVLITGQDGKTWQAVYTLKQQEDGSWKITGVKINPYQGAGA